MKHYLKKLLSLLLVPMLLMSLVMTASAATAQDPAMSFDGLVEKTASHLSKPGEYEIQLDVPGGVDSGRYNEIIIMVDASTSQSGNFSALRGMLVELAEKVLSDDPSMRMTIMGYGIGPHRVGSYYSIQQVLSKLVRATQDDFLQERSATNCEVGFEYINNYINNSPNLKKAVILYTSDGAANLDETERNWARWNDPDVFDLYRNFTPADAGALIAGTECESILSGNDPLSATAEMYPGETAQAVTAARTYGVGSEEHMNAVNAIYDNIMADYASYVSCVLKHIHMTSGLTFGNPYSASDIELAFRTYFRSYPGVDSEYYDSFMDLFYIILGDTGSRLSPNRYQRAANASVNLMANEKVVSLYHIGYSGANNTWMNPSSHSEYYAGQDISKLKYVYSTQFTGASEAVNDLTDDFLKTIYHDVTITDPMSKWVQLDPASLCIYDESPYYETDAMGNTVLVHNERRIWSITDGWLIDTPLTAESPVTLIEANENGRYEIIWKVKDGALLHTDRYSLRYTVNVDETVEGFEWGKDYPANDPTKVTFTDPDGNPQEDDVPVPDVKEDEPTVDIEDGNLGVRIYKQAAETHHPISDITFTIYKVELQEGDIRNLKPTPEEVAKYAVDENIVAVVTTDAYGYAAATLEEGIFLIVEAPSEKVVAPVDPFYLLLPYYGRDFDYEKDEPLKIMEIYPKNVPIEPTDPLPDPDEPDDPVDHTGEFEILKHDADDTEKLLAGAQFQILRLPEGEETGTPYEYEGTTVDLVPVTDEKGSAIILTTDSDGRARSPQLPVGLYFLSEIQAPVGYYIDENVVPVYATVVDPNTALIPVAIPNRTGVILPSTGGSGIGGFYLAGLILIFGSCLIMGYGRRRKIL